MLNLFVKQAAGGQLGQWGRLAPTYNGRLGLLSNTLSFRRCFSHACTPTSLRLCTDKVHVNSAKVWNPLQEAQRAQQRIAPYAEKVGLPTPLIPSPQLSYETDNAAKVYLKLDNLTTTLCFKIRGALNAMLAYQALGIPFDVAVAASAGNHSQGVALAARLLGKQAKIVMPEYTDRAKVERTRGFGAEVILQGDTLEASVALADELSKEAACQLIHPYDDKYVIAGQATLGLELLEQMPDIDIIIVPSGGGGLVAGIASVMPKRVRVIGVQASAMPSLMNSIEKGEVVSVAPKRTIAGGIAVGRAGVLPTRICLNQNVEVIEVNESKIKSAVKRMFEEGCLKVEGAAATGPAVIYDKKIDFTCYDGIPPKVAVVITGGNIGPELFAECMRV